MNVRLVPNQSVHGKYNIIGFDLVRLRKAFPVCPRTEFITGPILRYENVRNVPSWQHFFFLLLHRQTSHCNPVKLTH